MKHPRERKVKRLAPLQDQPLEVRRQEGDAAEIAVVRTFRGGVQGECVQLADRTARRIGDAGVGSAQPFDQNWIGMGRSVDGLACLVLSNQLHQLVRRSR